MNPYSHSAPVKHTIHCTHTPVCACACVFQKYVTWIDMYCFSFTAVKQERTESNLRCKKSQVVIAIVRKKKRLKML